MSVRACCLRFGKRTTSSVGVVKGRTVTGLGRRGATRARMMKVTMTPHVHRAFYHLVLSSQWSLVMCPVREVNKTDENSTKSELKLAVVGPRLALILSAPV